jgi:pimeloyl-ACP methyl ester carboxylesterase
MTQSNLMRCLVPWLASLQASIVLVVALSCLMPSSLVAVLLSTELLFGLVLAPRKLQALTSPKAPKAPCSTHEQASSTAPGWRSDLRVGMHTLRRMLDPSEAHAELLRDGSWFAGWWSGVDSVESLGLGNIAEFLSHTLLPGGISCGRTGCTMLSTCDKLLLRAAAHFASALGLQLSTIGIPPAASEDSMYHGRSNETKVPENGVEAHRHPSATFISHSSEPLKVAYRPLVFYALTELVGLYGHFQLTLRQGFRVLQETEVATYYVLHGDTGSAAAEMPPLVFLHGIGLGLTPYTGFLKRLADQHPGRTIVAVQYKHVSMRLGTSRVPTATEVADDVAAFLKSPHLWRRSASSSSSQAGSANVIAHSYGTLVASALAKGHGELLADGGLTLIDPVCFAMFLPHLVSKTLHFDAVKKLATVASSSTSVSSLQSKSLWSNLKAPFKLKLQPRSLLKGLVLRELHCAAAMSPLHFDWTALNLWTDEIPANTTVVLGGNDNMIPATDIQALLSSPAASARGVKLVHLPEMGHGGFLLQPELQDKIAAGASTLYRSVAAAVLANEEMSANSPLSVEPLEVELVKPVVASAAPLNQLSDSDADSRDLLWDVLSANSDQQFVDQLLLPTTWFFPGQDHASVPQLIDGSSIKRNRKVCNLYGLLPGISALSHALPLGASRIKTYLGPLVSLRSACVVPPSGTRPKAPLSWPSSWFLRKQAAKQKQSSSLMPKRYVM